MWFAFLNFDMKEYSFNIEHEQKSLTGAYEKRLLVYIAKRLPFWVTPDMLTGLALVSAIIIGVAYFFARFYHDLLWVAVGGWILHWFGDSLDGTVARVRKIERPRYGYYLDHFVDSIAMLCVFFGLIMSGFVDTIILFFVLMSYYLLLFQASLFAVFEHQFKISYGRVIAPTEMRLLCIFCTIILWLGNPMLQFFGYALSVVDFVGLVSVILAFLNLLVAGIKNARYLKLLDKEEQ